MGSFRHIWLAPITVLVYLFWILPRQLIGHIQFFSPSEHGWLYTSKNVGSGFVGRAIGPFIEIKQAHLDHGNFEPTIKHEDQHVDDQLNWGIFYPVIYFVHSLYLWVFTRSKHPYYDNVFERKARKAAGQDLERPQSTWTQPRNLSFMWPF